ncbi:hypothetical protein [Merismopedia glauca]|uniref:CPBP family intramembrane metalloprotease n=1 Tax=Merismopedia glauca CCAP 1448/3 TaxID=1296344 RepID=A0A2T1C985_9CYAN|nr:hypothetical protein [Merismopedia glauca]PSB04809.1 hypothetical protein C7B64_02295 [Merismopedia glauca CCAP 1448/3]
MAIETNIWIYWFFCAIATVLVIFNRKFADTLLSPDLNSPQKDQNYKISLILGWVFTLLASAIYILFTAKKETGSYELTDLIGFSFFNGVLEQFMFIFWFLVGCYLAQKKFAKHSMVIFVFGYIGYFLYSGLIHPLFWFQVLPDHEPFMPMAFILPLMSIFWMWLFWRYRAVVAISIMHIVIDFLTVGHLHFPWFESIQLI